MQIKGVRRKRNSRIKDFHNTLFFYCFFSSGIYKKHDLNKLCKFAFTDDDDFSLLAIPY